MNPSEKHWRCCHTAEAVYLMSEAFVQPAFKFKEILRDRPSALCSADDTDWSFTSYFIFLFYTNYPEYCLLMSSQKHIFPGKKLESSSSGSHNQLEMCGKSLENAYTNLKVLLVRNTLLHRCIGLASDTNLTHPPSVPSVCTLTARKILWCTRSKWAWLNLKEVSQLWARAAGFLGTNAFWKVFVFLLFHILFIFSG